MPDNLGRFLALAVADVNGDGVFDLLALRADGAIVRLSDRNKGQGWDVAEVTSWPGLPADLEPGSAVLLVEDLDNNGSPDLIVSTPQGGRAWLSDRDGNFTPLAIPLPLYRGRVPDGGRPA